jgi:hypothetical protein
METGWVAGLHTMTKTVTVECTTVPAGRTIVIKPQIYADVESNALITFSGYPVVYLLAISIFDIADDGA